MEKENVYRKLQQHLDKQAVGFPATKSGAEIRILKRFFGPEEARLAMYLSYQPRSPTQIYETVKASGLSFPEVESMLLQMLNKGTIAYVEKNNARYYYNLPFVVGIWEWQINKLGPEFLTEVAEYEKDRNFGIAMLSTKLPQMRTIPVHKSIRVEHHVTTYDNIRDIINNTESPIAILECICRKTVRINGKQCQKTPRLETCMAFGEWAKEGVKQCLARAINKAEALEIMSQNEADGLVLQPSNDQKVEFVCSCCGCCCGMLNMQKMLPKPVDFWATNYYAKVDTESCSGCSTCVERCQVNAVKIDEKAGVSTINLDRCIGCGNCVATCPSEALSLVKKAKETVPPVDLENLYKINAENKLGTFEKAKLMAKIVLKR